MPSLIIDYHWACLISTVLVSWQVVQGLWKVRHNGTGYSQVRCASKCCESFPSQLCKVHLNPDLNTSCSLPIIVRGFSQNESVHWEELWGCFQVCYTLMFTGSGLEWPTWYVIQLQWFTMHQETINAQSIWKKQMLVKCLTLYSFSVHMYVPQHSTISTSYQRSP